MSTFKTDDEYLNFCCRQDRFIYIYVAVIDNKVSYHQERHEVRLR